MQNTLVPDRKRHGIALAIVLFVIFVESVLGFAAISMATMDSQTATQEYTSAVAFNAARAGLMRACANLASSSTWAADTTLSYNMNQGGARYQVEVLSSSTATGTSYWQVQSTGLYNNAKRTIVAWLESTSFAKYAYFTDEEVENGTTIYFGTADQITGGPVHTNSWFSLDGTPEFSGAVTSSNVGDSYFTAATSTSSASYSQAGDPTPTNSSTFYHYDTGGSYTADYPMAYEGSTSFSFAGGQTQATLPSSMSAAQSAATAAGTTLNSNSGTITLTFNSGGTVTVAQTGQTTQTLSTTNLTLYISGTGKSVNVSGTVNGTVTVASTTGFNITGNTLYANKSTDTLGLVTSGNITVATSAPNNLEIDAAMLAYSTGSNFSVTNYNSGSNRGTLTIYGSLLEQQRGPVATLNGSGEVDTGYAKNYEYDSKLQSNPPPNFPTTGTVNIVSFSDQGALND